MVARHYGRRYELEQLRSWANISREGVSLLGISEAAEQIGLKTLAAKIDIATLVADAPLPCILHWNQNHFVVLYKVSSSFFSKKHRYAIADPAVGKITLDEDTFKKAWLSSEEGEGIALLLEPTPSFYNRDTATATPPKGGKKNELSMAVYTAL